MNPLRITYFRLLMMWGTFIDIAEIYIEWGEFV